MAVVLPSGELHPADAVGRDRIGRAIRRGEPIRLRETPDGIAFSADPVLRCEHDRPMQACLICLQLRHAEERSVAVRASYAFGLWPPAGASA